MVQPIDGLQGKDFIIVNYVDWQDTGILDHNCGTKTYNGHQGTDYSLRSFVQMDSIVDVFAAASGVITFVKDGLFDRETEGDVSKGLGNYIAIRHPNKYYSYYGHLKKGSLLVKVGDSVSQGDIIGAVGSSGNSTDAHLHFEVWYDSLNVVDPFLGACGNSNTLFYNPALYDTSLHIWAYGMHDSLIDLNALRERIETKSLPLVFKPTANTPVLFWSHVSGLKKGDILTTRWITPTQTEWFQYSVTMQRDWWYYFYFSYINNTDLDKGQWKTVLEINGVEVITQPFLVDDNVSVPSTSMLPSTCETSSIASLLQQQDVLKVKLTSLNGQTITLQKDDYIGTQHIAPGIYFLEAVLLNEKRCYQKVVVD
jgi:hypothetical protein